jgi:hypothetical protein
LAQIIEIGPLSPLRLPIPPHPLDEKNYFYKLILAKKKKNTSCFFFKPFVDFIQNKNKNNF